MLTKHPSNPILVPDPTLWWANKKIYNAAAFEENREYNLIFRAIGDDYISRLGRARSTDGVDFRIDPEPIFSPESEWDKKGCEDPRISLIEGTYWMAYTAFDGISARVALASTKDFKSWSKRISLFPGWREGRWVPEEQAEWSKAAALFPEQIGGKYYLFFGDDSVWPAESENLVDWKPSKSAVLEPRPGHFDASYVEMGPPPIKTPEGWLILYHGIDTRDDDRVYRLGAALLDLENPLKVIWRSNEPILEPTEDFEKIGHIDIIEGGMDRLRGLEPDSLKLLSKAGKLPQAIFCCGTVSSQSRLKIYYSGSDTVMCLAEGAIDFEDTSKKSSTQ